MAWLPGYEFDRRLTMSGSEKNNKPRPTAKVIQALHDYHLELDTNGITVITEGKAIALIEQALNMPWKKGEELAREG